MNKPKAYAQRTFVHEPLEIIKIIRDADENGKRVYHTPAGTFHSVTTRLESISKPGLDAWAERVGVQEANTIKKIAANGGSDLHAVCEAYLKNEPNCMDGLLPNTLFLFKGVKEVLDARVGKVYGVEIPLYSGALKTAGTCDLVCEFDGKLTVLDFKTARKQKEEGYLHSYYLQTAAYALMLKEMYGVDFLQTVLIIAGLDGSCDIKVTGSEFFSEAGNFFKNVLKP